MYGLNDAPLAWQLVLSTFFIDETYAIQSLYDENFYYWLERPGSLDAMATSHVDDNAVAAPPKWLSQTYNDFSHKFGGATKHGLPFTHTGVQYSDTPRGRKQDQDAFCQKLKPYSLTRTRASQDDDMLTPQELTAYRGLLGGLLWLCQTRLDLICDVVLAQQDITRATVRSL